MTCICGMVRDGHVYMAGDLMGSNGFTGKVYPDSKVFINGDFIIGYTSSFRMGQILEWNWVPPLREEGITDRQYMQFNVIESLRETFAIFGYGVKEGLESLGGNFLIGYKDSLYEMQENFSLLRIEDYAAVGSGQYHAEATLHLMCDNLDIHPFNIMQTAIGTAAHFTQSVSYECTMFSSDEDAEEKFNELMEQTNRDQQALLEEQLFGKPLPLEALEPLDKETLIKVIQGSLTEEEEMELFGDYFDEEYNEEILSEEPVINGVPMFD